MTTPSASTINIIAGLEKKLSDIAYEWRSSKDDKLVQKYNSILICMLELGFDEELDVDAELPDRLMPQAYLDLHR